MWPSVWFWLLLPSLGDSSLETRRQGRGMAPLLYLVLNMAMALYPSVDLPWYTPPVHHPGYTPPIMLYSHAAASSQAETKVCYGL